MNTRRLLISLRGLSAVGNGLEDIFGTAPELNPPMEDDYCWRTVSTQAYAQQPSGRRDGAREDIESGLRGWLARNSRMDFGGQRKVRMIACVEELRVKTQGNALFQVYQLREIDVGVRAGAAELV